MALVQACSCSSDLTPSLLTSICLKFGPKTKQDKTKTEIQNRNIYFREADTSVSIRRDSSTQSTEMTTGWCHHRLWAPRSLVPACNQEADVGTGCPPVLSLLSMLLCISSTLAMSRWYCSSATCRSLLEDARLAFLASSMFCRSAIACSRSQQDCFKVSTSELSESCLCWLLWLCST